MEFISTIFDFLLHTVCVIILFDPPTFYVVFSTLKVIIVSQTAKQNLKKKEKLCTTNITRKKKA